MKYSISHLFHLTLIISMFVLGMRYGIYVEQSRSTEIIHEIKRRMVFERVMDMHAQRLNALELDRAADHDRITTLEAKQCLNY